MSSKELALHAHLRQLPTLSLPFPLAGSGSAQEPSINDLCSGFMGTLMVRSAQAQEAGSKAGMLEMGCLLSCLLKRQVGTGSAAQRTCVVALL